MAIETHIDPERGVVILRIDGAFEPGQVAAALDHLYGNLATSSDMPVVWDARRASPAAGAAEDIRRAARLTAARAASMGTGKTAIVTAPGADYGMARMYQALTEDHIGRTLGTFDSMDEALAWLREA